MSFLDGRVAKQFVDHFFNVLGAVELHDEPAIEASCTFQFGIIVGHVEHLLHLNVGVVEYLCTCYALRCCARAGVNASFQLDKGHTWLPRKGIVGRGLGCIRVVLRG